MHAQLTRSKINTGFFAALALWLACDARSEVYRWTDDSGKVHYSDKKPKASADDITAAVNKQNIDESVEEQRKLQQIFRPENDADREYYRQQQSQKKLTSETEDTEKCNQNRKLLHTLSGRVQLLDKQGKVIKFTEHDRQQTLESVQAYLKENCTS